MKKLSIIVVFGILLTGCATPSFNYQAVPQQLSKPPIGSFNTAYVGDKMLVQGIYTERDALFVSEQKTAMGGVVVAKGYYLKTGQDQKGSYYIANTSIPGSGYVNQPNIGLIKDGEGRICILTGFMTKSCALEIKGQEEKISVASDNSFQQTLIYSGKVGSKINIGYREFSSNTARPAFNNDVEYDLSESKQIGYKGALLEIIDANNQSITYKVLKNFNRVDQ